MDGSDPTSTQTPPRDMPSLRTIAGLDTTTIDYVLQDEQAATVERILVNHGIEPDAGGKFKTSPEEFDDVFRELKKYFPGVDFDKKASRGGSTGNTLATLGLLTQNSQTPLKASLISPLDSGEKTGKRFRGELAEANITVFPTEKTSDDFRPARSLVIPVEGENGKPDRFIFSTTGDVREELKKAKIEENQDIIDAINTSDSLFLQGGLWTKLDQDTVDMLTRACAGEDRDGNPTDAPKKTLILALPTNFPETAENLTDKERDKLKLQLERLLHVMPSASLILGNTEEMRNLFTMVVELLPPEEIGAMKNNGSWLGSEEAQFLLREVRKIRENHRKNKNEIEEKIGNEQLELAQDEDNFRHLITKDQLVEPHNQTIKELETELAKEEKEYKKDLNNICMQLLDLATGQLQEERTKEGRPSYGWVMSRGADGAYFQARKEDGSPTHGAPEQVPGIRVDKIANTLGAGDTFFAGVIYGLRLGLPMKDAVVIGHLVASQVIQQPAAQLPDPAAALRKAIKEAKFKDMLKKSNEEKTLSDNIKQAFPDVFSVLSLAK